MLASSKRVRRATGFTLVELLVVIAIIGALMALLLPAISGPIGGGRRTTCQNNMQNLAKAMLAFESATGRFPGYSQLVRRSATQAVGVRHSTASANWTVISVDAKDAVPVSWAAMLLSRIERHDIWDALHNPKADANLPSADQEGVLLIRPIEMFLCPSDQDAIVAGDTPALSYSVNAGAPDWNNSTFLAGPKAGDTPNNGVFLNQYEFAARRIKAPISRISNVTDGAATTIMLSENCHKSYEPVSAGDPARFTWLFGTEQHLGIVWVVNEAPQPGNSIVDQERINVVRDDAHNNNPVFDPNSPRFARPASNHGGGANVVFCDGHCQYLTDDIDYILYQQLLTAQGRKCVDPVDHTANLQPGEPIHTFRNAPPLSAADFQ
jgi:prepilin-type N-terminal cleavage/methylation domain-containing protein/prepilin-type processing-associated H-X9-DG protein